MRGVSLRSLFLGATVVSISLLTTAGAPASPAWATPSNERSQAPETAVHDLRLDLATAQIVGAIALVNAAQNPNARHPDRPFNGHDDRAVHFLELALVAIENAMEYADASQ